MAVAASFGFDALGRTRTRTVASTVRSPSFSRRPRRSALQRWPPCLQWRRGGNGGGRCRHLQSSGGGCLHGRQHGGRSRGRGRERRRLRAHTPDIEHVAAGAVSGFTYGAVYSVTKNPTAAGAAAGAAGDAFTQVWNIAAEPRTPTAIRSASTSPSSVRRTAIGAGAGFMGGRIAKRFGPDQPAPTQEPEGDPDTWNFPRNDSDVPLTNAHHREPRFRRAAEGVGHP